MDFKKAYEDALERAKGIYNENPSSSTAKFVCGQIFPELKESEDERIRKEIINYLSNELHNVKQLTPRTNEFEDWIAYLEKQKEQNPAEWSDAERKKLYCDGYDSSRKNLALDFMHYIDENRPEGKMGLSNGECAALMNAFKVGDVETIVRYINKYQQPAEWSEDEKKVLDSIIDDYEKAAKSFCGYDGKIMLLKAIRDGEYDLPKQEWSEEDEEILDSLIRLYSKEYSADAWPWANGAITYGDVVKFLKSIRPTWKPSEEQMNALNEAVFDYRAEDTASCEKTADILNTLYNDLTKL